MSSVSPCLRTKGAACERIKCDRWKSSVEVKQNKLRAINGETAKPSQTAVDGPLAKHRRQLRNREQEAKRFQPDRHFIWSVLVRRPLQIKDAVDSCTIDSRRGRAAYGIVAGCLNTRNGQGD